jgi:hypothetical protein
LRGSKEVGVTIESYPMGKLKFCTLMVHGKKERKKEKEEGKKKRSKNNKSPNIVWET